MNQPTIEQFNLLQSTVFELSAKMERLDLAERKRDFTIRDSAVKIGIAEGLAEKTHLGLSKLELEMVQLRAEMKELRESNNQQLEVLHQRLDRQEAMTKENGQRLGNIEATQQRQEYILQEILSRLPPKQ